tara:strand:+ start:50 stop:568 length:519 start_codon:yes stop_codon:yes gene_type:complete
MKKNNKTTPLSDDNEIRRRTILNECPVCGAQPGNPCVTTRGNQPGWLTNPHRARYAGAKRKGQLPGRKFRSALEFPCTRCGAPKGDPCVTTRGKKIGQPTWAHSSRMNRAMGMPAKVPVDATVLQVPCPTCMSAPGDKCVTTNGDNRGSQTNTHVERRRAARVASKPRQAAS